jgi:hypoxanthine phosphoribosyltransferase
MAEDAFGHTSLEHPFDEDPMTLLNNGLFKDILIVDDMNDSGATINWIMKDWEAGCFPGDPSWDEVWNGNVKFAVLFDNIASKCKVSMDFVGEEINKAENDVWIDFPYEDWWTK